MKFDELILWTDTAYIVEIFYHDAEKRSQDNDVPMVSQRRAKAGTLEQAINIYAHYVNTASKDNAGSFTVYLMDNATGELIATQYYPA